MARHKIVWAKEAKEDLFSILDFYNSRNGNKNYSKKLFSKINKSIGLVAKAPFLGKATDEAYVRVLITEDYAILYEIFDALILVQMLWDCRRNPEESRIEF